ncbi:hypothetical protein [Bradyrhizobium sp. NAS80.1]|uniref:hypothetical protein n=1 Tax=Bradyrhizobium sp. NAS80.1 TaxID=1680159 RepID=UPI0009FE2527|nr:hypothetical protein [Bradyrhizobium sp. NAS80.1]
MPVPALPTLKSVPAVRDEPVPVTVTVPVAKVPMSTWALLTAPPFWIVSVPVPELPTMRLL